MKEKKGIILINRHSSECTDEIPLSEINETIDHCLFIIAQGEFLKINQTLDAINCEIDKIFSVYSV